MLNVQNLNEAIKDRGMTVEQFYTKCGMSKRKWYYWMKNKKPSSGVMETMYRNLEPLSTEETNRIFWN